jgi:hypothetical protein
MAELFADIGLQIVLSLLVAGLALPFVLARRRIAASDRERLARTGRRATGRVLEVWKDGEGWNVTYEFQPSSLGTSVRKTESFEGLDQAPIVVGDTIEIAYEARPPFFSVPVLP